MNDMSAWVDTIEGTSYPITHQEILLWANEIYQGGTRQILRWYHGTHIPGAANKELDRICSENYILFLKNWTLFSSSPIVSCNHTYLYSASGAVNQIWMIIKKKLDTILSDPAMIVRIWWEWGDKILFSEFEPEIREYISTLNVQEQRGVRQFYPEGYCEINAFQYTILAILEWVQVNADWPVSVI